MAALWLSIAQGQSSHRKSAKLLVAIGADGASTDVDCAGFSDTCIRTTSRVRKRLAMADDLDDVDRRILSSLTEVGPAKPIAYLALYTIRDVLRMDPHALAQDAKAKGLCAARFGPRRCCVKSGALYVFDRRALERLLESPRSILAARDWPVDPDQFVARIAREWLDQTDPVVSVIRRAFGEEAV